MQETALLRHPLFVRVFASYSVSMLGIYFDKIALLLLFGYLWQASPLMIALIPVAYALPQALLSQFAGVWIEKFNKVQIMMVADLLSAGLTLAIFLTNQPWLCLLLLLLRSSVTVVHFPAQQSLIKEIVPDGQLIKAISLTGTVGHLSKIIGPFMGGTIAGVFSPQICILINSGALFVSFLILFSIRGVPTSAQELGTTPKETETFWQSWQAGWQIVLGTRILFVSFLFSFFAFLVTQMIDIQFPVLFRELAPDRPELIGWLIACSGLGAFLMIAIMNRLQRLRYFGFILGGSNVLIGIGFGGSSLLAEGFPTYLPLCFSLTIGIGVGLQLVGFQYILQTYTTTASIARVSGIYNSITSFSILLAPILGALLIEATHVIAIFIGASTCLVILGLIGILFQRKLFAEKSRGD